MIGLLLGALVQGAGWGAGAQFAANHTGPAVTVPYWSGTVGRTTLALMVRRYHTSISYPLHVIEDGRTYPAGWFATYPEALAAIQQWDHYLAGGGSVARWLNHAPTQRAIGQ